jgi:hypothetical protein
MGPREGLDSVEEGKSFPAGNTQEKANFYVVILKLLNFITLVRYEVFTAVTMENSVLWDIKKPCSYLIGDKLRLRYRAQPVNATLFSPSFYYFVPLRFKYVPLDNSLDGCRISFFIPSENHTSADSVPLCGLVY